MSSRFYHDPSRHKHGCLLQPSRSGISLLFPSIFFCLLQKCNIIPQCCKEKHQFNAWNTLSPELLELVGSRRSFFFWPKLLFFFTSPRSFWSFDVTRNKEKITVALEEDGRRKATTKTWQKELHQYAGLLKQKQQTRFERECGQKQQKKKHNYSTFTYCGSLEIEKLLKIVFWAQIGSSQALEAGECDFDSFCFAYSLGKLFART